MSDRSKRNLLGSVRGSVLAWWLPIGAMVLAITLPDRPKTVIWLLALAWMVGHASSTLGAAAGCIAVTQGPSCWR